MIPITKNNLSEKLSDVTGEVNRILDEETIVYVDFLTQKQYKSRKQNSTFHALLDCFWNSGCSSFLSKSQMRFYYKKSVGLVDVVYDNSNLEYKTKQMLWKASKLLPLSNTQLLEVIDLLKGKVVKERSWSEATKEKASEAIDMILHDMDESGVITSNEGKHYEEILEGMNADNWWS
jgi:hypothetical protein